MPNAHIILEINMDEKKLSMWILNGILLQNIYKTITYSLYLIYLLTIFFVYKKNVILWFFFFLLTKFLSKLIWRKAL